MAMKCLGYPDTDPRLVAQLQELDRLEVPGEDSTRCQPSRSPVWDTAITMIALAESGLDRGAPGADAGLPVARCPRRSRSAATGR